MLAINFSNQSNLFNLKNEFKNILFQLNKTHTDVIPLRVTHRYEKALDTLQENISDPGLPVYPLAFKSLTAYFSIKITLVKIQRIIKAITGKKAYTKRFSKMIWHALKAKMQAIQAVIFEKLPVPINYKDALQENLDYTKRQLFTFEFGFLAIEKETFHAFDKTSPDQLKHIDIASLEYNSLTHSLVSALHHLSHGLSSNNRVFKLNELFLMAGLYQTLTIALKMHVAFGLSKTDNLEAEKKYIKAVESLQHEFQLYEKQKQMLLITQRMITQQEILARLPEETSKKIREFLELYACLPFASLPTCTIYSDIVQDMMGCVQHLQYGRYTLLPFGSYRHAIGVKVILQPPSVDYPEGEIEWVVYNTGLGNHFYHLITPEGNVKPFVIGGLAKKALSYEFFAKMIHLNVEYAPEKQEMQKIKAVYDIQIEYLIRKGKGKIKAVDFSHPLQMYATCTFAWIDMCIHHQLDEQVLSLFEIAKVTTAFAKQTNIVNLQLQAKNKPRKHATPVKGMVKVPTKAEEKMDPTKQSLALLQLAGEKYYQAISKTRTQSL